MNLESEGVPGLEATHDFTLWSVIVLFFVLLPPSYAFAKFRFARIQSETSSQAKARQGRPIRLMPSRATILAFACESVWLVVPYVVFGSFAIMSDPSLFASKFITAANRDRIPSPTRSVSEGEVEKPDEQQPRRDSAPVATSPSLTLRVGAESASPARAAPQRPAWVDQPRENDGDCTRIVLTSQQYATKEEAEQELRVAAVKLVEQDLQRIQTGSFRPQSWRPSADDVIAHAVQQRYDEIAERDFGKFTHPMIRVSWQVELSPRVRTEFAQAWRRELISFRILLVAGVASLFAMLASASVMYFRLDTRTRGQSRGGLKLLATSAMAGWLLLVIHSLRQGHLW